MTNFVLLSCAKSRTLTKQNQDAVGRGVTLDQRIIWVGWKYLGQVRFTKV